MLPHTHARPRGAQARVVKDTRIKKILHKRGKICFLSWQYVHLCGGKGGIALRDSEACESGALFANPDVQDVPSFLESPRFGEVHPPEGFAVRADLDRGSKLVVGV